MENNTFKGSLFGGFNRQDVISYIEKASKESGDLIEENRKQISAMDEENAAVKAQCQSLQESLDSVTASFHAAQQELESTRAACSAAQKELAECRESNREYEQKLTALEAENAALRPEVSEYHAMKTSIAEVELDAKHRAEVIVKNAGNAAEETMRKAQNAALQEKSAAEAEAKKIMAEANTAAAAVRTRAEQHALVTRQQLASMMSACKEEYRILMDSYKSAALQAAGQLHKMQENASQLPSVFEKIGDGLSRLGDSSSKKD